MILDLIHRLYASYKLRRVPKITLEEIINNQCKDPNCSNCKYIRKNNHCKFIRGNVSLNATCDEHVYDAKFLLREYKVYQTNQLKKMIDYRDVDQNDD